jgi:hypothetical protein
MRTIFASLLAFSTACAAGGDDLELETRVEEAGATTYVDIIDFTGFEGRWYDVERHLNAAFDDICGDTFCEGEYSNIVPLSVGCSVSSKIGKVRDCVWTFAAATIEVDRRAARVLVDRPTFQCPIHVATTAPRLMDLLDGEDPLDVALPGAPTLMEQLGECFEHPLGATPLVHASEGRESYVAASDYYVSDARREQWRAAQAGLKAGFDNICGDTFCGSDFGDLQVLGFECAITKSTGNVKECAWVFGGSWHLVPERGGWLQTTSKTWSCPVPVHGTLPQLIQVLTAPGRQPASDRPLPGTGKSAYEALLDCDLAS